MTAPGFSCCPDCGGRVLFALDVAGGVIAFNAAFDDGPWAVVWDVTSTPRCRETGPRARLREGEYRYAPHRDSCAALARVIPFAVPSQVRRTGANRRLA